MTVIPHQWRSYFARQAELDQRGDSSSTSWGIEAGLNHLLENPSSTPDHVTRVVASGSRRSRYAEALVAKYITFEAYRLDGVAAMEARSSLARIGSSLPSSTVALLFAAACGEDSEHLAADLGISVPALQTRVSRARAVARKLVA